MDVDLCMNDSKMTSVTLIVFIRPPEPLTLSSHPERASRVEGKHTERGVAAVEPNNGLDIIQPSAAGVNTVVSRSLCAALDGVIHVLVCVWLIPDLRDQANLDRLSDLYGT